MKLFSFLNRDCEDLLPAWLAHYIRLGVTEFRLIHHGPADDRAWLERFSGRYPVKIVDSFDGVFDEDLKCGRLSAALGGCRGEWAIAVDSDEFLEIPYRSLRLTIKMLKLLGAESLYAPMLQRMAVDGSLERVDAGADIEKLFPLGSTHLCERLCTLPVFHQKYPLFFNNVNCGIRNGSHFPPIGCATDELPLRGVTHHFKWRHAMLASMDQRAGLINANAPEIVAYRDYLESHGMKLPIEGAFHYSREKAFELGLLRRPEDRYLRRSVMMKELRRVPGDSSVATADRALDLARKIRARAGDLRVADNMASIELPADRRDLARVPLRICLATWELPGVAGSGGIATSMDALAGLLASAGHEVTIFYQPAQWFSLADKWLVQRYADRGIKFFQQRPDKNKITGSLWSTASYSCFEWLAGKNFDVIHFPDAFAIGHYTMRAKHQGLDFQNTLICITLHGPSEWAMELNGELPHPYETNCGFMERESIRLADAAISPSRHMLDVLKAKNYELPAATFVYPNVLRPSFRREARQGVSTPDFARGFKEMVFFGRVEERKGAVLFCDALDRIVKNEKLPEGFSVTFLGRSGSNIRGVPAEAYIWERAGAWNFPVKIEQSFSMQRAVDYLSQPECFSVIPSIGDNYPNTVLECLGASIPFVTFDSGGVPEMIHPADREKVLVKPDAEALAGKLQSALTDGLPIARPARDFNDIDLHWLEWHGGFKKLAKPEPAPAPPELPALTICLTSDGMQPGALKQATAALFKRTYNNVEVILATGGHPDAEMEDALSKIEQLFKDRKWRALRIPGASHPLLMQQAATMAETAWLLFLKDFQIPAKAMVETLLGAAVKTGSQVVTCGFSRSGPRTGNERIFIPSGGDISLGVIQNCFGSHHFLVKRSCFFELGGVNESPSLNGNECWHFFLKAIVAGHRVEVVPKVLLLESADPVAPNVEALLEPYLRAIPREGGNVVILAHHALTWLRNHTDFPSVFARPGGFAETQMQTSAILSNTIKEAGIDAEFGPGWHQNQKDGRWTGANGSRAEIYFFSPEPSRFINFTARVDFLTSGDTVSATLNDQPIKAGFDGDRLKLKSLRLQPGRNVLAFITRYSPRLPGTGDQRPLGALFSQIAMEPANHFGSEPVELAQWFERQNNALPPGTRRCIGNIPHVKHGLEAWFGEGWHGNELTHRWSGAEGRRCTLDIFSPLENARFTFSANLAARRKIDSLKISLNGKPVHTVRWRRRVNLKNLVLQKGLNVITMESTLDPTPLNGRDSRRLGWRIRDLEILPEVKDEISHEERSNHSTSGDHSPAYSQTPAPWEATGEADSAWASLLSSDPLIIHTWFSVGFPLGAASALGPLLRHRKAHFLIAPCWTVEPDGDRRYMVDKMRSYAAEHPLHRLTFLGNTNRETQFIAEDGFESVTVNHNCLMDDAVFRPLPHVSPIYDAIYNARISPQKRLELAAEIERLAIVSSFSSFEYTVPQFHSERERMGALMPHATFLNKLTPKGCEWYPPGRVNALLAQSRIGLCLSPVEGAMRASIEYLFAGLSVVSTPSLGGRDVYFDDEYCLIAEPDPRSIRDAVRTLLARDVPRDYVRAKTLARVEADRARYIAFVQALIDEGGGSEDFTDRFWEMTRGDTVMHWRSMREFTQIVMAALPSLQPA